MLRSTLLLTFVLAVTGCVGETAVAYDASYSTGAPDLVYVSPGVSVIADLDVPVFYADNYYWRYDRGVWFRSSYRTGGWAASVNVPVGIRRIDRPAVYAHTRVRVRPGGGRAEIRDHRTTAPATAVRGPAVRDQRRAPPAKRPVVRDHRQP